MIKTTVSIKAETNIKEIIEKVERLEALLKETNSIIDEITSDGLEIYIDMQ
ncbi:hypothetical protein [Hornefia butyriciproducens]|uniref:hypothetical protein n=1 Tax=Hornefia butyriciproducens TaxID=2652293 RepID=UPI002A919E5B|nr:hypothetical protein [Hornefia butyriciproducens]MDY5463209.1 hypothetical protein [Hornefia butyriciproducens]